VLITRVFNLLNRITRQARKEPPEQEKKTRNQEDKNPRRQGRQVLIFALSLLVEYETSS